MTHTDAKKICVIKNSNLFVQQQQQQQHKLYLHDYNYVSTVLQKL